MLLFLQKNTISAKLYYISVLFSRFPVFNILKMLQTFYIFKKLRRRYESYIYALLTIDSKTVQIQSIVLHISHFNFSASFFAAIMQSSIEQ